MFPVFRLFLGDKIIVWPWAMIVSSRNNLNTGNTFVDLTEHLAQSNSDNVPQTNMLSRLNYLYPLDKF